jgi:hypothetical protein
VELIGEKTVRLKKMALRSLLLKWNDVRSVVTTCMSVSQAVTFVTLHFVALFFLEHPSIATSALLACYFLIMPIVTVLLSIAAFNLVQCVRWMLCQNDLLHGFHDGNDLLDFLGQTLEELKHTLKPFWNLHAFVLCHIGLVGLIDRAAFQQCELDELERSRRAASFFSSAKTALRMHADGIAADGTVPLQKGDVECVSLDPFKKGETVFVLNNHVQMPIKPKTLEAFVQMGRSTHHVTNAPITSVVMRSVELMGESDGRRKSNRKRN